MRYALLPVAVLLAWGYPADAQNSKPPAAAPGTLQVLNAVVSQFEDGEPLGSGDKAVAGEMMFLRFDVAGFKTSEAGRVQLTGHVQAFDPRGTAVASPDEIAIGTSLRDEDKDWKPRLRSQFQIPPIAPPGVYRIRYAATDEQSHLTASGESSFTVGGIDVAASTVLAIRGLAFYRTPDDPTPLKSAVYRVGDMVWLRFEVTGYKYGEQNAIDVAYDVAVETAAGKQLFAQENAAAEKSQAFYPQPWVPGSFSLTLQPTTSPGVYSVSVTARDAVGNQTVTEKGQFRVE
ncbi:MAG: hypothetical protein M3N54_07105 [Acidobacteriota bacterium]|nr:hypothetical protein [Acidobacteriota bacterium]